MRLPPSALARDGLLAGVLTVVTQVELVLAADRVEGPRGVQHAAFAIITGSVVLRRRAPLAATLVCAAGMATQTVAGMAPAAGGFVAMLIVLGSLGYYASTRSGLIGLLAMGFAALLYDVLTDDFVLGDMIANTVIVVGAWGFAHVARMATDRRVEAEVAKDRFARDAVAAERSRIARDLHDSVAHALTLMTLQAGGASERSRDPVTTQVLTSIEDSGREALSDMHRFLRLLGNPDEGPSEAPGVRDLEDLVQRVRAAGLDVDLRLDERLVDLPSSVASTAYRVVQEGLTNAVKHSDAGRATVEIRFDEGYLVVDVSDDGAATDVHRSLPAGEGRGLAGLRDRVALFDGTLSAGETPDRGWLVEVSIPVTAQPS